MTFFAFLMSFLFLPGGLLQGNIDDMMEKNLAGRLFQPHGLGHFLGMTISSRFIKL